MPRKGKSTAAAAQSASLPAWRWNVDEWTCDDSKELAFEIWARLYKFNLPEFDRWLADFKPGKARDELLRRRGEAKDAALTDGSADERLLRHLEFMQGQQRKFQIIDAVMPSVRAHAKQVAVWKKAGIGSHDLQRAKHKDWRAWDEKGIESHQKWRSYTKKHRAKLLANKYRIDEKLETIAKRLRKKKRT